jgi:hypothetical protein
VKGPDATEESNKIPRSSMNEVKDAMGAERVAIGFILSKFPKTVINIQRVSYGLVGNREIWSVEGNMRVKTGIFSSETRPFKVQVSSNEEIMAYEF